MKACFGMFKVQVVACLLLLNISSAFASSVAPKGHVVVKGAIVRGDPNVKRISLIFTAADMADGADPILETLKAKKVEGSFFLTGHFYEKFPDVVSRIVAEGHYLGSHSDGHLLYSSWEKPDSMLVTRAEFEADLQKSYQRMALFGARKRNHRYWVPPYEHYNQTVSDWAHQMGTQLINFTPGTGINADYTIPSMKNYKSSEAIYHQVLDYEAAHGLNGFMLLVHLGTHPDRTDKFYRWLPKLIDEMRSRGYEWVGVRKLLR